MSIVGKQNIKSHNRMLEVQTHMQHAIHQTCIHVRTGRGIQHLHPLLLVVQWLLGSQLRRCNHRKQQRMWQLHQYETREQPSERESEGFITVCRLLHTLSPGLTAFPPPSLFNR